jgi:hypothetical protein
MPDRAVFHTIKTVNQWHFYRCTEALTVETVDQCVRGMTVEVTARPPSMRPGNNRMHPGNIVAPESTPMSKIAANDVLPDRTTVGIHASACGSRYPEPERF